MSETGERSEPRPEGRVVERVPGAETHWRRVSATVLRRP
jgi:hypothetical protein